MKSSHTGAESYLFAATEATETWRWKCYASSDVDGSTNSDVSAPSLPFPTSQTPNANYLCGQGMMSNMPCGQCGISPRNKNSRQSMDHCVWTSSCSL